MVYSSVERGYTIVELMVTVVIVALLAATLGMFVVRLLKIQENEREEAYVREKLADIAGAYADYLSIGSSVGMADQRIVATYRQETGGVSLETGRVSRVTSLESSLNRKSLAMDLNIYGVEWTNHVLKFSRSVNGDAPLVPLEGDIVTCKVVSYGALGRLQISARHDVRDAHGRIGTRTTSVERVVRLWNHQ